jgi:hypothetical protein
MGCVLSVPVLQTNILRIDSLPASVLQNFKLSPLYMAVSSSMCPASEDPLSGMLGLDGGRTTKNRLK